MKMKYYAHSLEGRPPVEWQPLDEHLKNVAEKARSLADAFRAGDWGCLAGLWHDVGKFSYEFQKKLHEHDENVRVDHSTAGAQHAVGVLKSKGRLLAYCISGHHAGLPNGKENDRKCLEARLKNHNIPDWSHCPHDLLKASDLPPPPFEPRPGRTGFKISFFIRMLFSCLVDADFLDTERFLSNEKAALRQGYPSLKVLWERLSSQIKKFQPNSPINKLRSEILEECIEAASGKRGFFSLTVPTGGGKTISSLAFALRHALIHGLRRVIYVIPYTSIIEQNAAVFRKVCGNDAVVEHHANFDPTELKDLEEEFQRLELATENWDAPIIVTTNVQFFESLFACRSSRCRKLHNITGSVIILDEAQMLPVPLLRPCLEALRELVETYQVSVVLCSATQPALNRSESFPQGLEEVKEVAPAPEKLHKAFQRVKFKVLPRGDKETIANLLAEHQQVLCIVNTRRHARELYEKTASLAPDCFHLSALMCPAHRSKKIAKIREQLSAGQACRVVSTQLIEAGVDIDFPVVFRAMAGIDSLAQAAGRCNREGRLVEPGRFFVFPPDDGLPPGYLRQCADAAQTVFRHHGHDPFAPKAVENYFRTLYWQQGNERLDEKGILFELEEDAGRFNFPFRRVAQKFRVIETGQESIVIPWGETGEQLVHRLRYVDFPGGVIRSLQRFTIQVPPRVLTALVAAGSVELLHERFYVLTNLDLYRDDLGLCPEDPVFHEAENLIV